MEKICRDKNCQLSKDGDKVSLCVARDWTGIRIDMHRARQRWVGLGTVCELLHPALI